MITLHEIAQKAGVSTSAVSHVLNGRQGKLGSEKRRQVTELLQKHRYQRNGLVRALQSKRTHSLGVLMPSVRFSFYAHILEEMEIRARKRGYHVFLIQTHLVPEVVRCEINHLRERRVDGFVVVPNHDDTEIYRELLAAGEKVVFLDSFIEGLAIPAVDTDDYVGASLAAKHLLEAGHQRFLVLAAIQEDRSPMAVRRFRGFLDTLQSAGIAPENIHIQRNGLDIEHGTESIRDALQQQKVFTAVLAMTDMCAIGAIRALKEAGVAVPEQVAVIGHGNLDEGQYLTPSLSTINQQPDRMGALAIDLILEAIEGNAPSAPQLLAPELIIRQSTTLNL